MHVNACAATVYLKCHIWQWRSTAVELHCVCLWLIYTLFQSRNETELVKGPSRELSWCFLFTTYTCLYMVPLVYFFCCTSVVRCLESFDFKHPHLDDLAGADKNPGLCPNDTGTRMPLLIQGHLEDFSTAPFILLQNHDAVQNFTYIVSASPLITCTVLPFRLFLFCPAK